MALPNAAWPTGMVTVAELLRRVTPAASHATGERELLDTAPTSIQVPVEALLRREGHTGSFPGPDPDLKRPNRPPALRRHVKKIAIAAGAVVTAGSVVAGSLWLTQPTRDDQTTATGLDQGTYPSEGLLDGVAPPDTSLPADPLGDDSAASLLPSAFPDLAAVAAAGTIPVNNVAAPAAPAAAPAPAAQAAPAARSAAAPAAAQPSGGDDAPAQRQQGPVESTVGGVVDTLGGAVGGVVGLLG